MKSKLPRYSAKKSATALAIFSVMSLLGTPASADTTYYYTGNPFTTIDTATILASSPFLTAVPNPNAEADAIAFGTNLTGFVIFDFDTAGVSGTFHNASAIISDGTFSNITGQWTTGNSILFSLDRGVSITLTEGAITAWTISVTGPCTGVQHRHPLLPPQQQQRRDPPDRQGRRPHPADQPLRPLQRHSRVPRHLVPTQPLDKSCYCP